MIKWLLKFLGIADIPDTVHEAERILPNSMVTVRPVPQKVTEAPKELKTETVGEILKIEEKPKAKAKIKIALDQSIGREKARRLKALGYEIVCVAQDSEPDDEWLLRAFDADALFVVSPDLDIPNLIEREGLEMIWIDYLHGQKGLQAEYIHKRIQEKMKFLYGFGEKHDS